MCRRLSVKLKVTEILSNREIYCLKLESHVVTLTAGLLAVAALLLQASRYQSGVSSCGIRGISSPAVQKRGMRVGKGKNNCVLLGFCLVVSVISFRNNVTTSVINLILVCNIAGEYDW